MTGSKVVTLVSPLSGLVVTVIEADFDIQPVAMAQGARLALTSLLVLCICLLFHSPSMVTASPMRTCAYCHKL